MGKRLLASPKKGSTNKKVYGNTATRKQNSQTNKSRSPVSVADLFLKQKQDRKSSHAVQAKEKSKVEVIDLCNSPKKAGASNSSPTESPYFSPVKNDKTATKRSSSTPTSRTIMTKLSLKRKHKSEPNELKSYEQPSKETSAAGNQEKITNMVCKQIDLIKDGPTQKIAYKSRLSLGKRKRYEGTRTDDVDFRDKEESSQTLGLDVSTKKQKLENSGETCP